MRTLAHATDHPVAPLLAGLALALAITGVHLWRSGDISAFVHAAPPWVDPAAAPAGLRVGTAPYDGAFYYRLALDPFTDRVTDHGITLFRPAYVQQRIGYPVLAWAVSGGDPQRVPAALVLVNVAGMAALGGLGGLLARSAGQHALWGTLFPLYPGTVMTIGDDLTEIVAAAALLAGLLLLRRGRPLAAGVALSLAALTRETTILAALAAALIAARASPRSVRSWLPLLAPAAVLALWQAVLIARWHAVPAAAGAGSLAAPLVGLLAALYFDPQRYGPRELASWAAMMAFVVVLVAVGLRSLRGARPHERLAWWAFLALATILEANVWANGAIVRTLMELGMLTALLSLGASSRARRTLLGAEAALMVVLLATGPLI